MGNPLEQLQEVVRKIGHMIGDCMPPGVGFTLLLFRYGDQPEVQYISSAQREDMIDMLEKMVSRLRGGIDTGSRS